MDLKAWRASRRKATLEEVGLSGWRMGTRKIESKKRYTRKTKHTNKENE